uniref:Polyprotein n=1 Tax=Peronospora matthiolae TaxID=2874970 RepID=A0AAV1TSL4_9STRA
MEAEFASASYVRRELLGLRESMRKIEFKVGAPMSLFIKNQAAIRKLENEGSMSSVKHVDVRMKFICDYARRDNVKSTFVESLNTKADLLTKLLPAPPITELRKLFNQL